eukprot:jgi/Tetstr1/449409/TSEL_036504.t1
MPCCSAEAIAPVPLLGAPGSWADWSAHPVLEHYLPEAIVGTGASSKVYRARCRASGDIVALKVVYRQKPNLSASRYEVLRSEAAVLTKIKDHPNIVTMLEYYEDERQLVMVLELLQGGEVLTELKSIHRYSEKVAAALCREMLSGLAHIHDRGFAHRDIKPENIILQRPPPSKMDGDDEAVSIKLIDLGMACEQCINGACSSIGVVGTIGFIAPEVCIGLRHTPAMDIWSMGIMLYVMLCGQMPYTCTQMEQMQYVNIPFRRSPGYLHERFSDLSFQAREMILQMLTHTPENRATAHKLLRHKWLTEADPASKPLPPAAPAGAQKVAKYRSSKGMANCVVAQMDPRHKSRGSKATSVLLADLENGTQKSHLELPFDPREFQHNYHENPRTTSVSADGLPPRRRAGGQRRWSDNIISSLSVRVVESVTKLKHTGVGAYRASLRSVHEEEVLEKEEFDLAPVSTPLVTTSSRSTCAVPGEAAGSAPGPSPLWELLQPAERKLLYLSPDGREVHYAVAAKRSRDPYHHSFRDFVVVGFRSMKCSDGDVLVGWCSSARGCDEDPGRRDCYPEADMSLVTKAEVLPPGCAAHCKCSQRVLDDLNGKLGFVMHHEDRSPGRGDGMLVDGWIVAGARYTTVNLNAPHEAVFKQWSVTRDR